MKALWVFLTTAFLLEFISSADAQTWALATGGSWNTAADWDPQTIPNATGAAVDINVDGNLSTVAAQTANRVLTLDANQTVGSVTLNFTSSSANALRNDIASGTATRTLIFNETGSGPAAITVNGVTGNTGSSNFSSLMSLTDDLAVTVNDIFASSAAGALTLTGSISGAGGITKNGDGSMTLATGGSGGGIKAYTGVTVLNGGRTRISAAGRPTGTSSLTINAGAQLVPITASNLYTFGASAAVPLNVNGSGPTTGPFAAFPGAIRQDTNLAITINNAVVLQSDSMIHVQGSATGSLTLPGGVSGAGKLIIGSIPHDADLGQVILSGTDSYVGGTKVRAGTLVAAASSTTAFGTGDVTVDSANLTSGGSVAKVQILAGATNAIADAATLSLAGGNAAGVSDDGYADLGSGINEKVGTLVLAGASQLSGRTYGSSTSAALVTNDEFFAGSGVITVGLLGDYSGNGTVDGADFVVWRKTYSSNTAMYDTWRANYGNSASGSGSSLTNSAVPEPSCAMLLITAVVGTCLRRPSALRVSKRINA
jgi:fibronectin-binding autotransporter adhesin